MAGQASLALTADVSKDTAISFPPEDSISDLSWSTAANLLAAASWDGKVRIYDVTNSLAGTGRAAIEFAGPVLSCSWSPSGHQVVGAGTDNTARLIDLRANGGIAQQVAAHDAPIRAVRFFESPSGAPMLVTGSWDKTIRYWDLRTPQPVGTVTCQDKVYSMDVKKNLLVVATAERHFHLIDLRDPMTIFESPEIPQLKWQARSIRCFPDATGYVVASIEGRCALRHIKTTTDDNRNFSFKCHRKPGRQSNLTECYSVNAICFHPKYGTLCTGGADGTMSIWDKENKSRIKTFPQNGGPISAVAFSGDGKLLAYAVSYDWNKGYAYNTPDTVNKLMIHSVAEHDVHWKPQPVRYE